MSTAMFIIQSVSSIMIDDLTRPEVQDTTRISFTSNGGDGGDMLVDGENGEDVRLSREQEDDIVRTASAGFTDWTVSFFTQVLLLFEALPEPGKGSRNGGKMEDTMTQTLIVSEFVASFLQSLSVTKNECIVLHRPPATSSAPNFLLPSSMSLFPSSTTKSLPRSALIPPE